MDQKEKFGLWFIIIFVVVLLSTAAYIGVNGYDKWAGDMKTAAVYLQAAGGGALDGPTGNGVDRTIQILNPTPVAKKTAIAKQAGQYHCPTCGMTGLPDYGPAGEPLCQVCNHKMDVIYVK